jgi:hypothetical protein
MRSTPVLAVGDENCIGCLRWRLYQMRLTSRIQQSELLRPGDVIVVEGDERHIYLGVCERCGLVDGNNGFEALLERIRNQAHPEYGAISWNGKTREITETVQFEGNGAETDEVIRARALRYLQELTEAERAVAEIDIVFREKRPVRAVVRAQTSELSPERLRELRTRAGLK